MSMTWDLSLIGSKPRHLELILWLFFFSDQAAWGVGDGEARLDRHRGDREDAAGKDEPPQRRWAGRSVSSTFKQAPVGLDKHEMALLVPDDGFLRFSLQMKKFLSS